MLHVAGKVLEVTSRIAGQPGSQFEVKTIALLTGKATVERVRVGRDFEGVVPGPGDEGEDRVYEVAVSAFSGKNGAGYQVTALRDVTDALAALLPA